MVLILIPSEGMGSLRKVGQCSWDQHLSQEGGGSMMLRGSHSREEGRALWRVVAWETTERRPLLDREPRWNYTGRIQEIWASHWKLGRLMGKESNRLSVHQNTDSLSHFLSLGEKPFLCEAQGCGRSFAEYSSLRKHLVVHSGTRTHPSHRFQGRWRTTSVKGWWWGVGVV